MIALDGARADCSASVNGLSKYFPLTTGRRVRVDAVTWGEVPSKCRCPSYHWRSKCENFSPRMLALPKHVAKNTCHPCRWVSVRAALALWSRQQGYLCGGMGGYSAQRPRRDLALERSLWESDSLRLMMNADV